MSLGEWILLIFIGLFLLLMLGGVVAWLTQLNRTHRRHHANNHARKRKR
ncbi:MAG: hypothetical protein ACODAQ_02875 [Phycisphaeraceae bacterium]